MLRSASVFLTKLITGVNPVWANCERQSEALVPGLQPFQHAVPVGTRAVEAVAVDPAGDPWHAACGGELPEGPGPFAIDGVRFGGD